VSKDVDGDSGDRNGGNSGLLRTPPQSALLLRLPLGLQGTVGLKLLVEGGVPSVDDSGCDTARAAGGEAKEKGKAVTSTGLIRSAS